MRIRVPGRLSRARATAVPGRLSRARASADACDDDTITLIYELLDAHQDTAEIAQDLCDDPEWASHLEYLRALQRIGREMLARMPADEGHEARR
jgi:hypothetical protein